MATQQTSPMTVFGFELGAWTIKQSAFMRGWHLAHDPEVIAAIEERNTVEYCAAKQALLARLRREDERPRFAEIPLTTAASDGSTPG